MQRLRRCCKNLPQRYPQAKQHSRKGKLLFPVHTACQHDPGQHSKKQVAPEHGVIPCPKPKARDGIQPDHQRSPGREGPDCRMALVIAEVPLRASDLQHANQLAVINYLVAVGAGREPYSRRKGITVCNDKCCQQKDDRAEGKKQQPYPAFFLYIFKPHFYLLPQGRSYTIRSSVEMTSCQPSASRRASASVPWLTMA